MKQDVIVVQLINDLYFLGFLKYFLTFCNAYFLFEDIFKKLSLILKYLSFVIYVSIFKKLIYFSKKFNSISKDLLNLNFIIQLCHDLCNTPFVQTFPRKSPENPGKVRKIKQ
jgi:hypothetical protein